MRSTPQSLSNLLYFTADHLPSLADDCLATIALQGLYTDQDEWLSYAHNFITNTVPPQLVTNYFNARND